jgi:hypothetical protein
LRNLLKKNSELFKQIEDKRIKLLLKSSKLRSVIETLKNNEKVIQIYSSNNKISQSDSLFHLTKIRKEILEKEAQLNLLIIEEDKIKASDSSNQK